MSDEVISTFLEKVLEKYPAGGYIRWGFDEPKPKEVAECPTREEVAEHTYRRVLSRVSGEILEKGRTDFFVQGFNKEYLRKLLQECLEKNYTVWYRKGDRRYSSSAEFYIATTVQDKYLEEYFDQIHLEDLGRTKIYEDIKE